VATGTQNGKSDREELQQEMIAQGKTRIHHYWKQENDHDRWRTWDKLNPQNRNRIATITKEVEEEMGKRKIVVSEEEDQLRWGRKNGGEFNLKEVWNYITDQDQEDPTQQWGKIWGSPQWPKIKMFKWLVLHNQILTWENLRKRGFIGPSRCHLCQVKEETTNHLLDECNYTTEMWDWATGIFRQSNRTRGNINATINNWNESYSENEMVNLCWNLMPGMIIWAIWKERNRRIFRNESLPEGKLKEAIISQIRETVQSRNCQTERAQLTGQDSRILETFHLKDGRNNTLVGRPPQLQLGARNWTPPPAGFLKLNFDGAEKGNPGMTGMGGVIRDSGGNIIRLYVGSLGNSTNNATEFGALELGLEILRRERMTNTIVEGDSTLVINTVKRIQNDTRVGKVQKHWRLAHSLQKIQEHLQTINTVELRWVRRSANGLADRISNEGVSKEGPELDTTWSNIPQGQFRTDCTQLATKDRDNSLSKEGHIEEGSERPRRTQAGHDFPTPDYQSQCRIKSYNRRGHDNKIMSTVRSAGEARGKASTTINTQLMT
jgi:ribonuclease HI